MRVFSRIALALIAVAFFAQPGFSQPLTANCPLTLVATNPPASSFAASPHGVFKFGSQVFVLRGQTLTTYTTTDLGDMQIAREDFITNLAGRNAVGASAFSSSGFLYVASEAGLEVFDLRNVRAGGSAPSSLARISNVNYRRLAVSGNTLVGLYPATDMPCPPSTACPTSIDFFNVASPGGAFRTTTLASTASAIGSFNDVAFNNGFLVVTGGGGTIAYDVTTNPLRTVGINFTPGTFLASNGTNFLAVGNDTAIVTYLVNSVGTMSPLTYHSLATLQVGRANRIMFHPQAFIDDTNNRLITIVDELDPARQRAASHSTCSTTACRCSKAATRAYTSPSRTCRAMK